MSINAFIVKFPIVVRTKRFHDTFKKEFEAHFNDSFGAFSFPILYEEKVSEYLTKKKVKFEIKKIPDPFFDLDEKNKKIHNLKITADIKTQQAISFDIDSNNGVTKAHADKLREEAKELLEHANFLEQQPTTKAEAAVQELNQKHAAVHISSFWILTEKDDDFTLENKKSFLETYENQKIQVDEGKYKSKAQIWLESPNRRTFQGITFDPSNKPNESLYNLWKDFSKNAKQGNSSKYWDHVLSIICNGNQIYYEYLRKWLAFMIQKPNELPETAIILRGSQGVGKGIFVQAIGELLGKHFIHLDNFERLTRNFNAHMKYGVLIFADEITWSSKADMGKVKCMISEPKFLIEEKNKDPIVTNNFRHFIFSTNSDIPLHIEAKDRRFFALDISDAKQGDLQYFNEILLELKSGGYEAILYDLKNEDIKDFNPRKIPQNDEAFDIKMLCANSAESYIFESLKAGSFDIGNVSPSLPWQNSISKRKVYNDYIAWCSFQNIFKYTEGHFSKILKRIIKSCGETRPRDENSLRIWHHEFISLDDSRKDFEKHYKISEKIWK